MGNPNTGTLGRDLRGLLPTPSVIALTDRPGNRKPIKELIEGKYLKVEGGEIVAADAGGGGTEDHRDLTHRGDSDQHPASAVSVDATVFTKNLNSTDTDVQKTLVTIDQLVLGVDDHKVAVASGDTPDYLEYKIEDGNHITWSVDSTNPTNLKLRGDVTWPTVPAADDHEVKATSYDITHGALIDELEQAGGTTIDVHVVAGKPLVRVASPPLSNQMPHVVGEGIPGPGTQLETARIDHNHPLKLPTAQEISSTLYPCEIPADKSALATCLLAPNLRWLDADAVLIGPSGCGVSLPLSGWTETSLYSDVWVYNMPGTVPTAFFDDQTPTVGMRLFIGVTGMSMDEIGRCGVYEMVHTGSGSDHATIQRASDASTSADFVHGKIVNILHGTLWAGHTFRYSGASNPSLMLPDPLPFYDQGTSSVYASGTFGFGTLWQQVGGVSTWQKHNDGSLPPELIYGIGLDGSGTLLINVNDYFFIWESGTTADSPHLGLYQLISASSGFQYPVIRRAETANTAALLTGLSVQITSTVALHYNDTFTETATITTLDTTNTAWTIGTPAGTKALLTAPQCTSLNARTDPQVSAESTDISTPVQFFYLEGGIDITSPPLFWTKGLNRTTLPAGMYGVTASITVSGGDPGAYVTLQSVLSVRHTGGTFEAAFLTSSSQPLYVGSQVVNWQATVSEVTGLLNTDELAWQLKGSTGSTTPFTVSITWQALGPTFLTVPFSLDIPGAVTGRHPDLTLRNVALQHPVSSTYPVIDTNSFVASNGFLVPGVSIAGDRSDYLRDSLGTGDTLYGIAIAWLDGTPIPDGFIISVFLADATPSTPKRVYPGGTPDSIDFLPIANNSLGGASVPLTLTSPTELQFRLDLVAGVWRLINYQVNDGIGTGSIASQILSPSFGYKKSRLSVSASTNILGIVKTGFLDGWPLMVDFPNASSTNPVFFINMADVSGFPTALPLRMASKGGVGQGLTLTRPSTVWFWLDLSLNCWRFDRQTIA
jgi:hypothetical protein